MKHFHIIEDTQIIMRSRGVFRQVAMYRRGVDLYAKHGGGFVRLMARGGTSAPNVSWDDMEDRHHCIRKTGGRFNEPVWTGESS